MKRILPGAALTAATVGVVLAVGGLWRVDGVNIVDDAVTSAKMAAGAPHAHIVVAASAAPAKVKATADYVCDGTDDDVQIQAAVDALPAYHNGGTVELSGGTFYVGTTVDLRGAMILQGQGDATYVRAGADSNLNSIGDQDVFQCTGDGANTRLNLVLRDFHIDGSRIQTVNDGSDLLGRLDAITGISKGVNTDANGRLYLTVSSEGGGFYAIKLYSDSGRTSLVAHTANYNAVGMQTLVADGASGIGGKIGAGTLGADADIYLKGNAAGSKGRAIYTYQHASGGEAWDGKIQRVNIMSMAGHGIELQESWGWIISDSYIEHCNGNGLVLKGGSPRVSNCKVMENVGHGIRIQCAYASIVGCQLGGGYSAEDADIRATGKAGVYCNASGCNYAIITGCQFEAIQRDCYGVFVETSTSNYWSVGDCTFMAGANDTDDPAGIRAESGKLYSSTITGCTFYNLGYGVYLAGNRSVVSGCVFRDCSTGAYIGLDSQVVGCRFRDGDSSALVGVHLFGAEGSLVQGCLFYGIENAGIYAAETSDILLADNLFYYGSTRGIHLYTSGSETRVQVRDNLIMDIPTGIEVSSGMSDCVLQGNAVLDAATAEVTDGGTRTRTINNTGFDGEVQGQEAAAGVTSEYANGRLVVTLTLTGDNDLDFIDGSDRGASVKLADLADGDYLLIGAKLNVTDSDTTGLTDPGADEHFNVAVGTTAIGATDATPAGTEANIVASTNLDIGADKTASANNSTAAVLTAATSSIYLNVGVLDTQIDVGDGTAALTGTVVIVLEKID